MLLHLRLVYKQLCDSFNVKKTFYDRYKKLKEFNQGSNFVKKGGIRAFSRSKLSFIDLI